MAADLTLALSEFLGITGGTGNVKNEILNGDKELWAPKNGKLIPRPNEPQDMDSDYKYSRENFYSLIERGQDAIDGILDLAKEGEHPRAYEVAGQLIKNVGEVTEKLVDLQEKMKKLKEVPDHGPKSVTNALFVGSTKELQKMLKSNG
jgi:hypothetical protein